MEEEEEEEDKKREREYFCRRDFLTRLLKNFLEMPTEKSRLKIWRRKRRKRIR